MILKEYSNTLQDVLIACKLQCINANIGKIQADIKRGIDKNFIINNMDCYI
jgi:hypothetical protein